jgi:hypothetical protein
MNMKSPVQGLRRKWNKRYFAAVAVMLFAPTILKAQEPAPSPPATPQENSSAPAQKPSKKKTNRVPDFLIRGTVFNEKALSFPGAELRIRVAGEKKYRWETYTNSRGEFAVRVPLGADYEVLAHVKGFVDQRHNVGTKNGGDEETVVFLMKPVTGGKK